MKTVLCLLENTRAYEIFKEKGHTLCDLFLYSNMKYLVKFSIAVLAGLLFVVIQSYSDSTGSTDKENESLETENCQEYITVDSVEYLLPARWCGKKIDTNLIAETSLLVKLPQELTFEDYKIYADQSARDAFVDMAEKAKEDSIELIVDSGFRSASFQKRIIEKRLATGEEYLKVINYVAPPGYSQHETGRALDMVPSEARFVHTDIYKWLQTNANQFGFYETYPEDKTGVIPWEPWHWYYSPIE